MNIDRRRASKGAQARLPFPQMRPEAAAGLVIPEPEL